MTMRRSATSSMALVRPPGHPADAMHARLRLLSCRLHLAQSGAPDCATDAASGQQLLCPADAPPQPCKEGARLRAGVSPSRAPGSQQSPRWKPCALTQQNMHVSSAEVCALCQGCHSRHWRVRVGACKAHMSAC